jgi:hypothetical protein
MQNYVEGVKLHSIPHRFATNKTNKSNFQKSSFANSQFDTHHSQLGPFVSGTSPNPIRDRQPKRQIQFSFLSPTDKYEWQLRSSIGQSRPLPRDPVLKEPSIVAMGHDHEIITAFGSGCTWQRGGGRSDYR